MSKSDISKSNGLLVHRLETIQTSELHWYSIVYVSVVYINRLLFSVW